MTENGNDAGAGTTERLSFSPVLLASASPRRRELLAMLGVSFVVVVSRFDEAACLAETADGVEYVRRAATGKAEEVAARRRDGIILGVDTDVIAPDGEILGKPVDVDDARRILRALSGKTHRVCSGICLLRAQDGAIQERDTRVVETRVTFAQLADAAIDGYVATGEPMDKAGGYAIQGGALPFVAYVEGDLSNVIGLPLPTLTEMLAAFGVPLWNTGILRPVLEEKTP